MVHIVYANNIQLGRVRAALATGVFNTALATVGLGLLHPFLPLVLAYDYYQLARYSLLLNSMLIRIQLSRSKQRVFFERLNFLGYWKKPGKRWEHIRDCKYVGIYNNTSVNPNELGWIPSLKLFKNLFQKYLLR